MAAHQIAILVILLSASPLLARDLHGFSLITKATQEGDALASIPTCGNTQPGSGTVVPFAYCPTYSVYNPASEDLSPPSVASCCSPTCGNPGLVDSPNPPHYVCGDDAGDSNYVPAFATFTNPTAARCCLAYEVEPQSATDISVAVQSSAAQVRVGQEFMLIVAVQVKKSDVMVGAEKVVLKNQLPAGVQYTGAPPSSGCAYDGQQLTCELGTLAFGEVKSISIPVKAAAAGSYAHLVEVSAEHEDFMDTSDNRASVSVEVLGACCTSQEPDFCMPASTEAQCTAAGGRFSADKSCTDAQCPPPATPEGGGDVAISKRVSGARSQGNPLQVGSIVSYQASLRLADGSSSKNVETTCRFPSGLDFRSCTGCTRTGQTLKFGLGELTGAEVKTIKFLLTARRANTYSLECTVTADNDSNPDNNKVTQKVVIAGACCVNSQVLPRTKQACGKNTFYATKSVKQAIAGKLCRTAK